MLWTTASDTDMVGWNGASLEIVNAIEIGRPCLIDKSIAAMTIKRCSSVRKWMNYCVSTVPCSLLRDKYYRKKKK